MPSYAILRHLGASGVREMIQRHCTFAKDLSSRLSHEAEIEVLNEVASNQVAIAFDDDDTATRVLERVQARGHVYPSHGEWRGRKIIRASIINYATTHRDIDLLADEIIGALNDQSK